MVRAVTVVLALFLLAFVWRIWRGVLTTVAPETLQTAQSGTETQPRNPLQRRAVAHSAQNTTSPAAVPDTNVAVAPVAPVRAPSPVLSMPVDPAMGNLVKGLMSLSGTNAAITPENVEAWRSNFQQLVQGGTAALPAIHAFLQHKVDYPFTGEVAQALGQGSARLAAFDALRQIGGPDAAAVMESALSSTTAPKEIAMLARDLDDAAPGEYRDQILAAARNGLEAARTEKDPNLDVAPLFEVYQHYGDASAVPDLEKATGQWKYYATVALADLPEGSGIPSLLKMAGGSGDRVVALEMVAQLAPENPTVREFLTSQVANKQIPANLWPYLVSPLSGDQYFLSDSAITRLPEVRSTSDIKTTHINYGNQNLYTLPGEQNMDPEALQQRMALVDDLLKITSDPPAVQALQRAQEKLVKYSNRLAAQAQAPATPGQ